MCASGAVGCLGMTRSDNCRVEHGLNGSQPVVGFETSPSVPSEHRRSVDEQHLLHIGVVGGGIEELLERGGQHVERVTAFRRCRRRCQIRLYLTEDGEKEILLVREVVVQRASGADVRPSDDLFGAGGEVALRDEQPSGCFDQCCAGAIG